MSFTPKVFEDFTYEFIIDNSKYIYDLLVQNKILLFRNIDITFEQHTDLMNKIHPLPNHARTLKDIDHLDLFESFNKAGLQIPDKDNYFMTWHVDDSWLQELVDIESIYMHTLGPEMAGGQTRWVDLEAIYKELDQEIISFIKDIKVKPWNGDAERDEQRRTESVYHGTIRVHPDTKNNIIFYPGIIPAQGDHDQQKWDNYIQKLLDLFEVEEFVFKLNWNKKDLIIWDNRSTAHAVMGGFTLGSRVFNKIEIGKSKPIFI